LEWLAEHTTKRYGLPCALELIGERIPLEIERRVLLFQAVREVVLNVVKHARASQVKVRVFRNQRLWRVDVIDDGVGVKLNELGRVERRENEGFGIFSLRERLQYLGGSLRIANRPKGGTHVSLVLPNSSAQPLAPEEEP
jgi:signal transduction histidine kinase